MTLKEKIENNLTIWALSLAATAFAAGVATDRWAKDIIADPTKTTECSTEKWQELAKKNDWMQASQCPAFPLRVQLSSPGSGTTLTFDEHSPKKLEIPFVVTLSRPLDKKGDIGFVVKPKNSQNYFVTFPPVSRISETNSYRTISGIWLPIPIQKGTEYEVRGLLIDKEEKMGDRFTDLSQIMAADQSVMMTDPISLVIER